jgi:outer membrane protein OmpA-like peptidoglycan-associated protein/Tol biopolymer transport system component
MRFLLCFCWALGPWMLWAQVPRPIGPPINTAEYTEYAPSISADNKMLIYETDRAGEGKWELYFSVKNDKGKWAPPKPITRINAKGRADDLIGGPSISYDGKILFFFATFNDPTREDIYFSEWNGTEWGDPQSAGSNVNTPDYEGFPSLSADGKKLYFIRANFIKRKDKELCYAIWMSNKQEDGTWGPATKLPAPINLECEKSPRIMADGRTLIFSSVRKGGLGSFDLYSSVQEDDGTWSEPQNLEFVNSDVADQFASISANGDLMYFQSEGDIYVVSIPDKYRKYKLLTIKGQMRDAVTKKPLKGKFTLKSSNAKERPDLPQPDAEGNFIGVLRVGSKYTFSVANVPDYQNLTAVLDLSAAKESTELVYNLDLMPNKIPFIFQLIDKDTKALVKDPKVRVMELDTKTPVEVQIANNQATVLLKIGTQYKFAANAPGYSFFARNFKPDSTELTKDRTKRIPLQALKKDVVIQLSDIYFETAKADLKPESYEELDRLAKMLEDSPQVRVEISAHTDDVGSDEYNLKLSDRRAKSVVDFLVSKNVKPENLLAKGYGETQPLAPNDTDENRAKNRRVQFKILN